MQSLRFPSHLGLCRWFIFFLWAEFSLWPSTWWRQAAVAKSRPHSCTKLPAINLLLVITPSRLSDSLFSWQSELKYDWQTSEVDLKCRRRHSHINSTPCYCVMGAINKAEPGVTGLSLCSCLSWSTPYPGFSCVTLDQSNHICLIKHS